MTPTHKITRVRGQETRVESTFVQEDGSVLKSVSHGERLFVVTDGVTVVREGQFAAYTEAIEKLKPQGNERLFVNVPL